MIKQIQEIKIYGDLSYRDKKCPLEAAEQITFINRVRKEFPDTHGLTLFHEIGRASCRERVSSPV